MKRMKTFFKYFLAIVIVYFLVNLGTFYVLKSTYKTKDYTIEDSILDIQVTEAEATFVNGNIKGVAKNNTDANVSDKYLKIESYSKRDVLLGTKYVQLKNLNPGEETSFEASFNYQQIDHIKVSVINAEEVPKSADVLFDNPEEAKINFLIFFAALFFII